MNISDNDWKKKVHELKDAIKAAHYKEAFDALRNISSSSDDFVKQMKYSSLFSDIPRSALDLKPLRIAVLATSTVSHFIDTLKFWLAKEGFSAEFFESEFTTIHQTILSKESDFYSFKPDFTLLFINYRDIRVDIEPGAEFEQIEECVHSCVREYTSLWETIRDNSNCFILQNNADLPDYRIFGNYEGSVPWSRTNMLRLFNLELGKAAGSGVAILDMDYVSSRFGKHEWHDSRYWYHSKHAFALDASGIVAFESARLIGAVKGTAKKCVVIDLDNTLWGGVIADDGIEGIQLGDGVNGEAFADFQRYLLDLKNRGVILAVCSKNEDEHARVPFLSHPDMLIKLEDISVFIANWNDKASNIEEIAETLNIGLDSVVFVDDNPAERALVKNFLPMVSVPELPEDPAGFIRALDSYNYFETVSFSEEDRSRSEYYRKNATRKKFQKNFSDLADFLKNLQMVAKAENFDAFNLPRIVQLINKSNQFNLTTIRYTESEIVSKMKDDRFCCRYYYLKDIFGENGLISVVILEKQPVSVLKIDTWVMSCRVLSRGMEDFIADDIVAIAREEGCEKVQGAYIQTKKNALVHNLYSRLNFDLIAEEDQTTTWELNLNGELPQYEFYISKEKIDTETIT